MLIDLLWKGKTYQSTDTNALDRVSIIYEWIMDVEKNNTKAQRRSFRIKINPNLEQAIKSIEWA
jgi:hypothetical protein